MVGVGRVEQLSDGCIDIGGRGSRAGAVGVGESQRCAAGAVIVEVAGSTAGVGLGNAVVTTSGGVVGISVTDPGVLRGTQVPRVADGSTRSFGRIVETPCTMNVSICTGQYVFVDILELL